MKQEKAKPLLLKKDVALICQMGGLAPSGGNVQPWMVTVRANTVEVSLDPSRSTSFLDVNKLASVFAVGSFVENVLITLDWLGYSYSLDLSPTINTTPLVKITATARKRIISQRGGELFHYIKKRATNRRMSDGRRISEDSISLLKDEASRFVALPFTLRCVSENAKKERVAGILGEADAIRFKHPALRKQMFQEIRFTQEAAIRTKDGIDIATMELPKNVGKLLGLLRQFDFLTALLPKKTLAQMAKPLLLGSSHLCCLYSTREEPSVASLFNAGRLTQRLWLRATQHDLAFHPWTVLPFFLLRVRLASPSGFQAKEEEAVKRLGLSLNKAFGASKNMPVFIFRLSYADEPTARSLRLPWQRFTKVVF